MKNKLLFLALEDITILNKAPSIRMGAIHKGFEKILGKNYYCISGRPKQRAKLIRQFIFKKKFSQFSYLYIESSNKGLSIWDMIFLIICKINKVSISVYVRDVYPLFKNGWIDTNFKGKIANLLWIFSIIIYKLLVERMYFPSESCKNFIRYKQKSILSPALYNDIPQKVLKINSIFYAGGLLKPYNLKPVLEAINELSKEINITFTIYCRENETKILEKWRGNSWINIEHKNINQLEFSPQIGIISSDDSYQHIARSIKLLDYIRLGIPVIISDAYENSKFVKENQVGLIAEQGNSKSFYKQIKLLLNDFELYKKFKLNVLKLQNSNEISWDNRCKQILNDFNIKI